MTNSIVGRARNWLAPAEAPILKAVLALPPQVLRLVAGRQILIDGQQLDLEMQAILRLQKIAGTREPGSVSVQLARANTDRQAAVVGGRLPIGDVVDRDIAGPRGRIRIRIYTPTDAAELSATLVFFHGGGWVVGSLDSHEPVCRFLAEQARVRVVAVDYRLAPEHRFPAAVEDCWAAYEWVCDNAALVGADPGQIAVGGDSAGGNLAASVALLGRDAGRSPAFQLLLYPGTDFLADGDSKRLFGSGFYLTTAMMDYYTDAYLSDDEEKLNPLASPLQADGLSGLCPAYVMTAGFDPLRDEGEAYAAALAAAGVKVTARRFEGMIHSFVNMVGVGRSAPAAMAEVAAALKNALQSTGNPR